MRVLITHSRFLLGGSETYAVTVAEQLERLGHPTAFFAGHASPEGRELLSSRGLTLATGEPTELADRADFDVVLAQDAASAYAAGAKRNVPIVFVVHGLACFEHPPQASRAQPPVVVMNDRLARHVGALAGRPEVVRLRQPIDLQRFKSTTARSRAKRVLVFSNYLQDDRMAMLQAACDDLGLELTTMGATSKTSIMPQDRIVAADIVVGYGRSILEGMAMGRAAYVWDRGGGDGWVTPETYPAIEADGFSGGGSEAIFDVARLREDLSAYRSEFGPVGYDLVRNNHSAQYHAEQLVQLLEREVVDAPPPEPAQETLGLLARAAARLLDDVGSAENQLRERDREAGELRERLGEIGDAGEIERQRRVAVEQRLRENEEQLAEVLDSASWRLTTPLRSVSRRLRALRGRLRREP